MNNVDYEQNKFDVDGYGNLIPKGQIDNLNPEANGFYNTPAECENVECMDCHLSTKYRREIDCPYLDAR